MSTPAEFHAAVGREVAVSDWVEIAPADEQIFQQATFLDRERLGGPVQPYVPNGDRLVSGFLLLSMLIYFHHKANPLQLEGGYALNYGADKVRFLGPVLTGQRVRDRITLSSFTERIPGQFRIVTTNTVEVEGPGEATPVMVADWITYYVGQGAEDALATQPVA